MRQLPSVDFFINHEATKRRFPKYPKSLLLEGIRKVLDQKRNWILSNTDRENLPDLDFSIDGLLNEVELYFNNFQITNLKKVINGTGVILHTNLGRAILAEEVVEQLSIIAGNYCNLEIDLFSGKRGQRGQSVTELLRQITGAEDAIIVNNNAASVLLALNTFAENRQVIVSRGELIEIGGSFRIPEILKKSSATLVEVGTTNKTRLTDYQKAVTPECAAILKVNPSNYQIVGFTEEVSLEEVIDLGKNQHIITIYDLGSGSLVDLSPYGLKEPFLSKVIQKGPDIVTFSADKLLGGPQAGILLCKKKYAKALRENPLNRVLRPDKMTLSCLEKTLHLYKEPSAISKIPVLSMITSSCKTLRERGERIVKSLSSYRPPKVKLEIVEDISRVGGGAFPRQELPSFSLSITLEGSKITQLANKLRLQAPPILGRIHQEHFYLNLRTIQEEDIPIVIHHLQEVLGSMEDKK